MQRAAVSEVLCGDELLYILKFKEDKKMLKRDIIISYRRYKI